MIFHSGFWEKVENILTSWRFKENFQSGSSSSSTLSGLHSSSSHPRKKSEVEVASKVAQTCSYRAWLSRICTALWAVVFNKHMHVHRTSQFTEAKKFEAVLGVADVRSDSVYTATSLRFVCKPVDMFQSVCNQGRGGRRGTEREMICGRAHPLCVAIAIIQHHASQKNDKTFKMWL